MHRSTGVTGQTIDPMNGLDGDVDVTRAVELESAERGNDSRRLEAAVEVGVPERSGRPL
jgi:hypothetical protein